MLLKFTEEEESELRERKIGLKYALKSVPVAKLHVRLGEKCGKFLLLKSGEDEFEGTDKTHDVASGRSVRTEANRNESKGHSGENGENGKFCALLPSAGEFGFPVYAIDVSNMSINEVARQMEELRKSYAYISLKRDPQRDITELLCYIVYPNFNRKI